MRRNAKPGQQRRKGRWSRALTACKAGRDPARQGRSGRGEGKTSAGSRWARTYVPGGACGLAQEAEVAARDLWAPGSAAGQKWDEAPPGGQVAGRGRGRPARSRHAARHPPATPAGSSGHAAHAHTQNTALPTHVRTTRKSPNSETLWPRRPPLSFLPLHPGPRSHAPRLRTKPPRTYRPRKPTREAGGRAGGCTLRTSDLSTSGIRASDLATPPPLARCPVASWEL